MRVIIRGTAIFLGAVLLLASGTVAGPKQEEVPK